MNPPIENEEYKEKWEYIRHTETLQNKQLQWYFATVGVLLTFIYGPDYVGLSNVVGQRPIPLLILVIYSILFSLRMIRQKKNYEIYISRLVEIEGRDKPLMPLSQRVLSSFNLQYYSIALVGAVITKVLMVEWKSPESCSWVAAIIYAFVIIGLSFTKLVEE